MRTVVGTLKSRRRRAAYKWNSLFKCSHLSSSSHCLALEETEGSLGTEASVLFATTKLSIGESSVKSCQTSPRHKES
jgi:hypothetical protein